MCIQKKEQPFSRRRPSRSHAVINSLQSHSSPKRGALNARFDCALVLSPGFCHQVGFSFLQTSPLCCLLLLGELPAYFLTDHLLQDTQKATADEDKASGAAAGFCVALPVEWWNSLLHCPSWPRCLSSSSCALLCAGGCLSLCKREPNKNLLRLPKKRSWH